MLIARTGYLTLSDEKSIAAAIRIGHEVKFDDLLTPKLAQEIKTLWTDPAIQACYELRSNFQLLDTAKYFFDRVGLVCSTIVCVDRLISNLVIFCVMMVHFIFIHSLMCCVF